MTTISAIIASFGEPQWEKLGRERALPSTEGQGFDEVIQHHDRTGTLAEARNAAAEMATGQWLLFLDADDELEPGYCEAMRAALRKNRRKATLFTPAVIYQRNNTRPAPKIWPRMDFKVGNWCIIGTLINRDIFLKIGGFKEYALYEDYALWASAEARFGVTVVEVPDAIYVAHHNRKSRNRTPPPRERLYWHQRIGRDVWPDSFGDLFAQEDETHQLSTSALRFTP